MAAGSPFAAAIIPDVLYRAVDGITLMAEIVRPDPLPAWPLPAIIYVHGGGWMQGDRTANRNHFLAEQGFFTLSVDYRLSWQAPFPAQLEDVRAAVRWVRRQASHYRIDPRRIGIWGHSAGAHLAALVGTTGHLPALPAAVDPDEPSSNVQAVATLACPTDFLQMGGWHEAADSPEARLVGGPIRERVRVVQAASPITYVQPGAPPFLLIHGEDDDVVPCGQSALFAQALRAKGNPVTYVTVPNAGHNFGASESSWAEGQRLILDFFQTRLYARRP
jgi:acetyl esterase/lipase